MRSQKVFSDCITDNGSEKVKHSLIQKECLILQISESS